MDRVKTRPREPSGEAKIRAWVEDYALKKGWTLNTDEKILATVICGLVRNQKKFGMPYCPCRLRSGDDERERDIICLCLCHEDGIARDGHCHSWLYFWKDAATF